jgi:hypothetical protein
VAGTEVIGLVVVAVDKARLADRDGPGEVGGSARLRNRIDRNSARFGRFLAVHAQLFDWTEQFMVNGWQLA